MTSAPPTSQLDGHAPARQRHRPWWLLAMGLPLLIAVWPWLARDQQALAVVVLYIAFTAAIWRAHRGQRAATAIAATSATLVAYASQSGGAQRLAELTARELQRGGEPVVLLSLAQLRPATLNRYRRALFIVSTYGEGEAPDNGVRFDKALQRGEVGCAGLDYAVLALGDGHYRNYCAFGRRIAAKLDQLGANPLFDAIEIDARDELATGQALTQWQLNVAGAAGSEASKWQLPSFDRWRLTGRRHLNPGSPGAPVFKVTLEPIATTLSWQAGDIAEILPYPVAAPGADGNAPGDAGGREQPGHRDYSIASLPASGVLQLLVRQHRDPSGCLGIGSGWLTQVAMPGDEIAVRIRANPTFHGPPASRPLILIGNGTGWAGLRAHLLARPEGSRNWLLFGERSPVHDCWVADELATRFPVGLIERADFAYSRAESAPCYVQQRLREAATQLEEWLAAGAAIYVCGSAAGMAQEVVATLRELLGDQLDELASNDRYRRDVY